MGGTRYCCVVGCKNSQSRNRELTFYSFPGRSWEIKKRNEWIKAVRRITSDNKPWQPSKYTRICSAHFIGGKQSNVENSPAYVPTIFPPLYKKKEISQSALTRHERLLKRKEKIGTSTAAKPEEQENNANDIEMGLNGTPKEAGSTSIACQTDACDYKEESAEVNTFWSWNNERNEASTQTNIHIAHWKLDQRAKWIAAVNRKNVDGTPWYPKHNGKICSADFIGGKKADEQASPSYVPTIFPKVNRTQKVKATRVQARYSRLYIFMPETEVTDTTKNKIIKEEIPYQVDQECQVNIVSEINLKETTFICNTFIYTDHCDSEIQVDIKPSNIVTVKKEPEPDY